MSSRGLSFMAPLVPRVLDGSKTVTRRVGRKPAEVGDLLWIREAWRTHAAIDHRPHDESDREWWHDCGFGAGGLPSLPPVWYGGDYGSEDPVGRPRQARFLPMALARPWRGEVVSVERVPGPVGGWRSGDVLLDALAWVDDAEAIREGAHRVQLGEDLWAWTLDDVAMGTTPADAFAACWQRLHPDDPAWVWRVEWRPVVSP